MASELGWGFNLYFLVFKGFKVSANQLVLSQREQIFFIEGNIDEINGLRMWNDFKGLGQRIFLDKFLCFFNLFLCICL